jgi:hypothetical protein
MLARSWSAASALRARASLIAGILGVIGFANISFGAAIVGETRRADVSPKAEVGLDAMKAEYRRPPLIPFPKDNPYTLEKASLGKRLYFDTRLSAASAQSCASCHSPGFGWGDGLAVGVGHGMAKLSRRSGDNVPHNIASTSKGNEFNLGSQPPGASTDVTFTAVGEAQVVCAIHPRMKMMVQTSLVWQSAGES